MFEIRYNRTTHFWDEADLSSKPLTCPRYYDHLSLLGKMILSDIQLWIFIPIYRLRELRAGHKEVIWKLRELIHVVGLQSGSFQST